MNTPQHPPAPEPAALAANPEPAPAPTADSAAPTIPPHESFSGWLVSSVELFCGMTVTHLGIDATEPGWREIFGLAALP